MKIVFVTGVAGFIGSNLANELLKRNYKVIGVDNFSQGLKRNIENLLGHSAFEFHEGDVPRQGIDAVEHKGDVVEMKPLHPPPPQI